MNTRYPIVGGAARDNVDKGHSPATLAELPDKATAPSGPSAAANTAGIDVSAQQHPTDEPINWSAVASGGYRFAGIKASEGDYYQNDWYDADRDGAEAAGMYPFAYHFATPNDSTAVAQADHFLDIAGYTQNGTTLNPALDLEPNPYPGGTCYGLTPSQMTVWITAFVDRVYRRAGVKATIYTTANWWNTCTGGSSAFADHPLWVASAGSTPTLPTGWTTWSLWQHTDTGTVPGINGPTPLNYVNGTDDALAALASTRSTPSGFTPATPVRVLDTRNAIGTTRTTPLGSREAITLDLSAQLPATATAAVLNVTGIATATTYVTVWGAGRTRPNVSNLNLVAGDIRSNLVTVQVHDRKIQLYNHVASTHLLADLAGWYASDAPGGHTPRDPHRVLNTLTGVGAPQSPVGRASTITLDLSATVPTSATAVTLNLTGVNATNATYLTAWPTGQPRPNASNLNVSGAHATPNLVTVALGTNKSINLYNNSGTIDLLADLAGHYNTNTGDKFIAVSPLRLLNTRQTPVTWQPATGGGTAIPLTMLGPVPTGSTAAVLNLTGIAPTATTYVSIYPKTSTTPTRPSTSNLNLLPGQTLPNLTSVTIGPNSDVWLFNNTGTIDLLADLAGYYTP